MESVAYKMKDFLSPEEQLFRERTLEMWNDGVPLTGIGEALECSPSALGSTICRLRNSGEVNFKRRNFSTDTLEYDIYKGDTYIFSGTAKEVSERLGVKISTIQYWASPKHRERCEAGSRKGYIAYRYIEDDEEM